MKRYAILRETDGEHLPVGIAVERERDVMIVALDEFGLPKRINEPYKVLQRDLSVVQYTPGSQGYFEQVLLELQRTASIGEIQQITDVSREALIELLNEKVVKPRLAAPRIYAPVASPVSKWSGAIRRVAGFGADTGGLIDDAHIRVAA